MAHAQKNYPNVIQGIRGKYSIAQIGCFVTSFCNLSRRFGDDITPNSLNHQLVKRGIYIDVDDGIRDDLGWGSITQYNKNIVVEKTGTGTPPHKNAIVRVPLNRGYHFALVDRIEKGVVYIVDSWDGQVKKSSVYGPISAWATYKDRTPVAVKPNPQAPKPKYVTVKKGQFLSLIARINGITLGRLLNLNPKKKRNPNLVVPGEKIRVK